MEDSIDYNKIFVCLFCILVMCNGLAINGLVELYKDNKKLRKQIDRDNYIITGGHH